MDADDEEEYQPLRLTAPAEQCLELLVEQLAKAKGETVDEKRVLMVVDGPTGEGRLFVNGVEVAGHSWIAFTGVLGREGDTETRPARLIVSTNRLSVLLLEVPRDGTDQSREGPSIRIVR